jgi:hypothetical protein
VYPLAGGGGINLNTAPPWVLIQLLHGSDVSGLRPLQEDDVERIVEAREEGPLCSGETTAATCRPLTDILGADKLEPPPTDRSNVFLIRAIARVLDVERRIETAVDRTEPTDLVRLSWAVQ